jgi:hypothetical protein
MKEFQQELRAALRGLVAAPQQILSARYLSESLAPVDVENVLLYNVGVGAFKMAAHDGLRVERRYQTPPPLPSRAAWPALHYQALGK